MVKCSCGKPDKPVVYDHFWRLIPPNDRKCIKKALGFSVKVEDVLRLRKTMENHWLEAVLQLTENVIKYLIKPVVS